MAEDIETCVKFFGFLIPQNSTVNGYEFANLISQTYTTENKRTLYFTNLMFQNTQIKITRTQQDFKIEH